MKGQDDDRSAGWDDRPAVEVIGLDQRRLPSLVFEEYTRRAATWKNLQEREEEAWYDFGKPGRDPQRLGSVTSLLAASGRWGPHLKMARLRNRWDTVVGPAIAAHSHVASYREGVLTIQAETTAWATQLTYLVPQLKGKIVERLGMPVTEVKVTGPHTYSFRRGPYDPPGRGVRDTYG